MLFASFALHAAVIGVLANLSSDPPAPAPKPGRVEVREIEIRNVIVRPAARPSRSALPTTAAEPRRRAPEPRHERPPPVRTVVATNDEPRTDEHASSEDPDGRDDSGFTGASSGKGVGVGSGEGGVGSGGETVDLSSPPVPIDTASSRVLPYTEAALRVRAGGDVRLVLEIGTDGRVTSTSFRGRIGFGLDEIAAGVARRFRFRPARNARGVPIVAMVSWRFHFVPP